MSCNDCGGADTTCSDCADKRIAALEAKLAEVKGACEGCPGSDVCLEAQSKLCDERDAAMAVWGAQIKTSAALALERNALRAEVARLRAAMEPTADNVRAYEMAGFAGDITPQDLEIQARIYARNAGKVEDILAAIRARAGEGSAPGSSLREKLRGAYEAISHIAHCRDCGEGACPCADASEAVRAACEDAALGEP